MHQRGILLCHRASGRRKTTSLLSKSGVCEVSLLRDGVDGQIPWEGYRSITGNTASPLP